MHDNMWVGYTGLALGFIILITWAILTRIEWPKKTVLQAALIFVCVWFGVVMWLTSQSFFGWPSTEIISPEQSRILSIRIKEPDPKINFPGAIYLWLELKPEIETQEYLLNGLFSPLLYFSNTDPRSFRIPYTRELHKKINQLLKQQKGMAGSFLTAKGKKGKAKKQGTQIKDDQIEFKIINPVEILSKERAQD